MILDPIFSYFFYFLTLFFDPDIGKRVKACQLDILLVVNMFLTGFDSKALNTIYVDKNLRYHGLIQAYSRTNPIMQTRPKLKERKTITERIIEKIKAFIETFIDGVD